MLRVTTLLFLFFAATTQAQDLRVAVASNFAATFAQLLPAFERQTGHRVKLASGSSGKHFAQIMQGAPFDLFLAADKQRPRKLQKAGLVLPGMRHTYAIGQLVFYSRTANANSSLRDALAAQSGKIAIANPRLAPYGSATRQALQKLGLWKSLRTRLVRGENIAQAYQFVRSNTASAGLIAASQWQALPLQGTAWALPSDLHAPIEQQMVLLSDTAAAKSLYNFLRSPRAKAHIKAAGYLVIE